MFSASLLYACVDPLLLLEQVFNSSQKKFAYVPTCRNSFKKQVIFNPYPQSTIQLKLGVAVSGSQVYVTIQAKTTWMIPVSIFLVAESTNISS